MKIIKSQNYIDKQANGPLGIVPPQSGALSGKVTLNTPPASTNVPLAKFETLFNFIDAEMQTNNPNAITTQEINTIFKNPQTTQYVTRLETMFNNLLLKIRAGKNLQQTVPGSK